jgi:hypothetical protein
MRREIFALFVSSVEFFAGQTVNPGRGLAGFQSLQIFCKDGEEFTSQDFSRWTPKETRNFPGRGGRKRPAALTLVKEQGGGASGRGGDL